MKLQQLTEYNFRPLKDFPIYILSYSEYYLKQLCADFDILDNICGGFDEQKQRQGEKKFNGRVIFIEGYDKLNELPANAVLLIAEAYHIERFNQIRSLLANNDKTDTVYFYADREMQKEMPYRKKYEHTPLRDIIVFRSGFPASTYIRGEDFTDNARALFEYMLKLFLNYH